MRTSCTITLRGSFGNIGPWSDPRRVSLYLFRDWSDESRDLRVEMSTALGTW